MEDIFKPSSLTIKQLFGNTDSLYQIPRYQRPYSWGDEQLSKLWDDLLDAQENDPNYFLGSIITAKPEDSSSYIDIVDGQQRLTTLTIFLCVYRDLFPEINSELLDIDPYAIDNKILESSIKFNDRFERLRLRTHSNHQSDFETIILKGKTSIHLKPLKKELQKDDPKFKFQNTANFFTNKLSALGEEDAGKLLNYLFNQVKIIRIDCHSVAFAIKLFQVLNDRGLDLTNSDLIKSHLIGKIQKIYETTTEIKKQKEEQFMDDWKACENIASETDESMNDLFVMYEYYLLAQNPKKSLYEELVDLIKNNGGKERDPNDFILDLKNFALTYKEKIYDKEDKLIYSFYYLGWSVYWKTILTTAYKENYSEIENFTKLLRRYYYLNWIAGNTLSRIKQMSFNLIKWLKENKSIVFIENEFNKNLEDTTKRAIENLNGDIYFEKWCKPLLFLIEYNQIDDSNVPFLAWWERSIQVEHIIPRGFKSNKEWKKLFEHNEEITNWINTGANLTLLSGTKNIQASNNFFNEKIKAYQGKGYYKNSQEGVTSFRITQKIVDEYNEGKFEGLWNEKALNSRWEWFCKQIEEILEINI
jgi:uncharacterized protein with ParB-like and HNH nuclease domain